MNELSQQQKKKHSMLQGAARRALKENVRGSLTHVCSWMKGHCSYSWLFLRLADWWLTGWLTACWTAFALFATE